MFWPAIGEVQEQPRSVSRAKPQQILDPNATGCDACALQKMWGVITTPRMKMSGNRNGDIMALAEGPGEVEDRDGAALIGPSGKLLRENIPRRDADRLTYQNIVRCRPEGNRTPTLAEAHACSVHLDADIASMKNLRVIIGIGGTPLRRFFPGSSIMRIHGLKFPIAVGGRTFWYYPVFHPAFVLHREREDRENPAMPVFRADMKNLFANTDRWGKPTVASVSAKDVVIPANREEAEALIAQMVEPIAVDIETSKLRPYERGADLLTASFSDGKTTIAFPCNHPSGPTTWGISLLIDTICRKRWIAHNAAFELLWFMYYNKTGQEIAPFEDTMALARIAHERESVLDLAEVSHVQLGVNVKRILNVDAKQIMSYPLEEILPYNGLDSWASARIARRLGGRVDSGGYRRILGSIWATARMELDGLPVDIGEAVRLRENLLAQQQHIRTAASKLYEVRQYEADRGLEFKITSPEQVGAALVAYGKLPLPLTTGGKTGKQQYSTDEAVLRKHADQNPLARAVLDDREISKILTYVDPTLDVPKRYPDGNIHPTYTTMFTSTMRLSSRDPNIQNYPVRKHREVRRMIALIEEEMIRRYGRPMLLCKFDYGQLEARVLAMASRDRNLVKSIIDKFDIHSHWLHRVLDIYPDYMQRLADLTGETDEKRILKFGRDCIKSDFVFASLYGANADSCVERTGIPHSIVHRLLGDFWETYRGVRRWHKDRRNEYRDSGGIKTLTGRLRRGILSGNEPINYPIQGTAADIVIEAMNEMSDLARLSGCPELHPRINIHDDLTFILPDDDSTSEYIDVIHPILTKVRFGWQIVPLTVEVKVGNNWAELYDVDTFEGSYVH